MDDPMAIKARFVHTNLISRDWKKLVRFYCNVLGCVPKGPDRNFSGDWLDRLTALRSAHLRGIHLLLPGYGEAGPTLEIFSYDSMKERSMPTVNESGFAHIAFAVDDVDEALEAVKAAGGGTVGEIVLTEVDGVGSLRVVYARDPEGNIVELQKWS
jgi:catechol 2,3-dioxygenase-like lactoylglutathione lyase family enzyme